MENTELKALTDQELLEAYKKAKSNNTINSVLIGFLVGVAVYGIVKNGFGFFSLLPLALVYILFIRRKNSSELENELKARNLK